MKFTKATAASLALPAGKSDHFEWDDATPGFGIRLRGDRRTWTAQIRVHGRTRRLAIGDIRQIDLEPARAAAKKFFAEATLGNDPAKSRAEARAKAAITVGGTVEKYLTAREAELRPGSFRQVTLFLRQHFKQLHGLPLDSVTRREVAVAVEAITKNSGPVAGARARTVLSGFYSWALRQGLSDGSNPVEHTNRPGNETPRERVLAPQEIRSIWLACSGEGDFPRILRLLFLTACRRSEIGSLEWSEINFDRALLTIPGEKVKNHRTHRLPLVPEAAEILRSVPRREGNPFVFGPPRQGYTAFSYAVTELHRCLAATGDVTGHWQLHDIRRTVRSEMGDLGIEPWIGEQILNHARAGIEGTYNWATLERQMRQALGLWGDRLRCIVEGTESNVVALRA